MHRAVPCSECGGLRGGTERRVRGLRLTTQGWGEEADGPEFIGAHLLMAGEEAELAEHHLAFPGSGESSSAHLRAGPAVAVAARRGAFGPARRLPYAIYHIWSAYVPDLCDPRAPCSTSSFAWPSLGSAPGQADRAGSTPDRGAAPSRTTRPGLRSREGSASSIRDTSSVAPTHAACQMSRAGNDGSRMSISRARCQKIGRSWW